ncbi:helix-turn-helix domain-containing protein [Caballeronia sp. BR00000012568055]|uniref:helix-turn-helix domain-containing protein n=1 Tax=Caballeronia sp. BR00000012568055 TaxID=2918761 RepID=UPI0023F71852|nr:helix-turn-helix transcriptional regulator [Caballeronia sp. BR00000012568055]
MRVEKRPTVWGLRVKQARERLGLSQKSLGINAGLDEFVASARINRYEQGVHKPDEAFSRKIAEILQVPDAFLHAEDDSLALLIAIWGVLPDERRERLTRFAIELSQQPRRGGHHPAPKAPDPEA